MMHNGDMRKDAAVTIRLPAELKQRLDARARRLRRSVSSQVTADLQTILSAEPSDKAAPGAFLGLFAGARLPTDEDIEEVRADLWGHLAGRGQDG